MATYYPRYYFYIGGNSSLAMCAPRLESRLIDFSVRNVATSDVVKMIPIIKNSMVMTAGYQTITTVTSASSSFAITDGTNTFVAATTAVAAGSYGARPSIAATNTNVLYSANADITLTTVTVADLTVGQIKVFAVVIYPDMVPSYVDADGNTKTYVYTDSNNWTSTLPTIPITH